MRALKAAVFLGALFYSAQGYAAPGLSTKTLATWCEKYLAGQETQSPGVLCATWFLGWIASYRVGANGKQEDGTSVFGICEPSEISAEIAIRAFANMVQKYPAQFEQQYFDDPTFSVPYALSHTWPCVNSK
jgi:hypothetical protein